MVAINLIYYYNNLPRKRTIMEVYERGPICDDCRRPIDFKKICNDRDETNKCQKWLESCSLNDDETTSYVSEDSEASFEDKGFNIKDQLIVSGYPQATELHNIINKQPNHYENIQVYKSKKVHIGDVTNINGPVFVNQYIPTLNQQIVCDNLLEPAKCDPFFVVPRRTWLAQPPLSGDEVEYLEGPAKFVIISHSASEEAYTQTENNLNVRLIQQFHIECRKWNDIAYNFLVGADGSIFEGRGWKVVGAHAYGYNIHAIGICFIGYFSQKSPPTIALRKTKEFIRYGVKMGYIAEDYKLLGHCQCSSTESPGKALFEELKSWEHWDSEISVEAPSPLVRLV